MTGTPENARLWTGADIYVGAVGVTAPNDLTDPWTGYDPLGLLGTDGLTESRDEDINDFFAWGGVLVRTVRSKHKRTFTFVALEDNPVTFRLLNPGSTIGAPSGGIVTKTVRVPTPDPRAFGIELRDGDLVTRRRLIPRAEVTAVGDITYGEEDLAALEFTVTVYPASDGVLYFDIDDADAYVSP